MIAARDVRPVLAVVGGLPATGKSTICAAVARTARLPYLRVDRIEQTLVDWSELEHPVGAAGYAVAYALAAEQLALGLSVVAECVNPLAVTRDAWADTAAEYDAVLLEVEVVCSDAAEHRRRVESRETDVPDLVKPTWSQVMGREYEPWVRDHLVLDTATLSLPDCRTVLLAEITRTATVCTPR